MCPFAYSFQMWALVVALMVALASRCIMAQFTNERNLTPGGANAIPWKLNCNPDNFNITMYQSENITCEIYGPEAHSEYQLYVTSVDADIAKASERIWLRHESNNKYFSESFNVTGSFLGKTEVLVQVRQRDSNTWETEQLLKVLVTRQKRVIDVIFHASVAILVSLMYINFGCALNWGEIRQNLTRPIGPVIGCVGQFLVMPLVSFFVGRLIFPYSPLMQLGMFFTGVSPGGGASNMWTVILDGNVDLSITMTTISTFAAFFMMPVWLFTLGTIIFDEGEIQVPYNMITKYAIFLVIPLFVGFLIKRYLPRVGNLLRRMLKCFSAILLIFIITFATVANLYLFKLFSWKLVIAGMGLPWLGYALAYSISTIFRQPHRDCLAIAIETGVQNTGIAIYMLRSLGPLDGDLTTVVPVSVAIMTPIPLFCLYIWQKVTARCQEKQHLKLDNSELNSPLSELTSESASTTKMNGNCTKPDDDYKKFISTIS